MKRLLTLVLATGIVLSVGLVAFADSISTPAEIYGNLTGKTVEEAYELKGNNKTFGQLAQEAGVYDKFKTSMLEMKKQVIADKVENGELTQEKADEILKLMETGCDGTGSQRLGQKYGMGFGKGSGKGSGKGLGRGCGVGRGNAFGRK
ncbi:DUF2680 domain-containing protein [Paramaledivibacter caminithermalis]|uniref:DUF2680 domain-containing protein n=1 Tax=Paramaledivibacter caminithermalis (strain DSM 15212 / CIP 107654 / DViRD3) TaxID=1121301 RepID=A0A1M6KKL8_PARC5|nr:DUF2680 domain-containing protein [Paramaledivibacter caminithermalis]SHJ59380.1 Protein of unknown function [Paramaledivibacter caminithermalis DSM 15212]